MPLLVNRIISQEKALIQQGLAGQIRYTQAVKGTFQAHRVDADPVYSS